MKNRWFEKKEIRDIELLTEDQIKYLKEGSITIFGPFNVLVRKHWDLLFTPILLGMGYGFLYGFFFPNVSNLVATDPRYYLYQLSIDLPVALIILIIYGTFGFKNGRRLAWNRNKWESFEKFQESEEKWDIWGYIGIAGLLFKPVLELLFILSSFTK